MAKNDEERIKLSENLKNISKKMSLRRVALEAGIPQSSLASWSHGQLPSGAAGHKNLRKLSVYLKCSIEELMYGDVSQKQGPVVSLNDLLKDDVFAGRFIVDLKIRKVPEDGKGE